MKSLVERGKELVFYYKRVQTQLEGFERGMA